MTFHRHRVLKVAGLTLLETMISIAVLTVGIVGTTSGLLSSFLCSQDSASANIAGDHLSACAEMVRGTPFQSLQNRFPNGGYVGANDMNVLTSSCQVSYPAQATAARRLAGERILITYWQLDSSGNRTQLAPATLPAAGTPFSVEVQLTVQWFKDGKTSYPAVSPPNTSVGVVCYQ